MRDIFRFKRGTAGFIAVILISLLFTFMAVSCSEFLNEPTTQENPQDAGMFTKDNPIFKDVLAIQERNTEQLMKIPGVIGTAVGLTEDGRPCVLVLTITDLKSEALAKGSVSPIPDQLEDYPVQIMVTGEIKAFKGGGGGISHTAKQTPPIQLGTSGGWRYDLANGYCCGGTLGSLVQIGENKYVLSNYHVLEADMVPGGNDTVARTGDFVIQPGLIDVGCSANNSQNVATLVEKNSLPGSNVDAAVAQIIPGMVSESGSILEIGILSSQTVPAAVNQPVKKSGRTTGLTRSKVSGLNANIRVSYENECAGGAAFTKDFSGQIIIANKGSRFLAGGDSGSCMVEDVTTNPKAVGLLFAGSSSIAVANPIGHVLSFLNATMVGN